MHKKFFLHTFLLAAIVAAGSSLRATDSGVGLIALTNSAPVFQDFDSLSSSTTPSGVLPDGWYLTELPTAAGAGGDGQYAVGTGSSATGGAYSFGLLSNPERALGSVGSGSALSVHYGAKLTNAGSGPITALTISFDGEMWRRGNSIPPNGDRLTFAYSLDADNSRRRHVHAGSCPELRVSCGVLLERLRHNRSWSDERQHRDLQDADCRDDLWSRRESRHVNLDPVDRRR